MLPTDMAPLSLTFRLWKQFVECAADLVVERVEMLRRGSAQAYRRMTGKFSKG